MLASGPAGGHEVGQVVEDRLHPRAELLVLVAGQIADVTAHGHDRAGHQQLVVAALDEDLDQPGGEGEQGLARAGRAQQRDELDLVVQQQVQGHGLLHVAGHDAVDRLSRPVDGDEMVGVGQASRQPRRESARRTAQQTQRDGGLVLRVRVIGIGVHRSGSRGSGSGRARRPDPDGRPAAGAAGRRPGSARDARPAHASTMYRRHARTADRPDRPQSRPASSACTAS